MWEPAGGQTMRGDCPRLQCCGRMPTSIMAQLRNPRSFAVAFCLQLRRCLMVKVLLVSCARWMPCWKVWVEVPCRLYHDEVCLTDDKEMSQTLTTSLRGDAPPHKQAWSEAQRRQVRRLTTPLVGEDNGVNMVLLCQLGKETT